MSAQGLVYDTGSVAKHCSTCTVCKEGAAILLQNVGGHQGSIDVEKLAWDRVSGDERERLCNMLYLVQTSCTTHLYTAKAATAKYASMPTADERAFNRITHIQSCCQYACTIRDILMK